MIVSYDIDGVLAAGPPPSIKKWGRMNGQERSERKLFLVEWYKNASPLYLPPENKFYAFSARKNEENVFIATKEWLTKHFPERILGIELLSDSRSVLNAATFKSNMVKYYNVEKHYEDNKQVLKIMKQLLPNVELYFWKEGMNEPVRY